MDKTSSKMFQCKEMLWDLMEEMAKDYGMTRDYLINVAMTELAHSKGYLELPKNKNKNKVKKMKDSLLDEDNHGSESNKKSNFDDDVDFPDIPKPKKSNFDDDLDFPEIPKPKKKPKKKPRKKPRKKPNFDDDMDFPDIPKPKKSKFDDNVDFPDITEVPNSKQPNFDDDMDFPDIPNIPKPNDDMDFSDDDDFGANTTDIAKPTTPITPPTPTPPKPKKPKTPPKPPSPKLFVECDGDRVAVNKTKFVIGRGSQADLRIMNNPSISRRHALVIQKGGKYYIKDLGSINGTEYKGKKYDIRPISNGDVFTICDVPITFRFKKS